MRDGVITASPEREQCIRVNIADCYEKCNTMFTALAHNHTRCQDVCMREASAECRHAEMMAKLDEIHGQESRARIGIVNILYEIRTKVSG